MKIALENIPVITKINVTRAPESAASPCCAPKAEVSACCEPSKSNDENNGACCAQPTDGSACCNK